MFENVKEPVDIFAETDKAKPPISASTPSKVRLAVPAPTAVVSGPPRLLYVAIGLVLLGLGGGYYFFIRKPAVATPANSINGQPAVEIPAAAPPSTANQPSAPTGQPEQPAAAATTEPQTSPEPQQPVTPPETATQVPDDDGDGLSNAEEAALGTNPEAADTDSDGLTDYEEVKIYHTDPTKPDTDGDGFLDGQEVKAGYNPNGSGKLLILPPAQ